MGSETTTWDDMTAVQRQARMLDLIGEMLDVFDAEQRTPDGWEATHLSAALGAVLAGLPGYSLKLVGKAAEEETDRLDCLRPADDTPTLQDLRRALERLRALSPPPG